MIDDAEFLRGISEGDFKKLSIRLNIHLANLKDLNSVFPETKKFLQARGLCNVGQLDVSGQKDLRTHLECVLLGLQVKKL